MNGVTIGGGVVDKGEAGVVETCDCEFDGLVEFVVPEVGPDFVSGVDAPLLPLPLESLFFVSSVFVSSFLSDDVDGVAVDWPEFELDPDDALKSVVFAVAMAFSARAMTATFVASGMGCVDVTTGGAVTVIAFVFGST